MRIIGGVGGHRFDPVLDAAIAQALLRQASDGQIEPTVRIYRPTVSTLAFGRGDLRRPRIAEAVRVGRAAGYVPVVRSAGGRAVGYTPDAVVVDHVAPDSDPSRTLRRRFIEFGALLTDALRGLGIDARVGEVPGEYCPGEYSVNARGEVKLIGTAQRVVRGAWLFSAIVIVDGTAELKPLLRRAYDALEYPFEDRSVGSVATELGGVDVATVEAAIRQAYVDGAAPVPVDQQTLSRAESLRGDHIAPVS